MHSLVDLGALVAAAELGSLTEAARVCGVTRATLTRHLESLEARLGVTLLERSTRRLSLTTAGRMYYVGCRDVLAELGRVEAEIKELDGTPRGKLRIGAPFLRVDDILGPIMTDFALAHPEVEVQVELGSGDIDPITQGFDVVLQVGFERNNSLIARRLFRENYALYASPAYLERRGMPHDVESLAEHASLMTIRQGATELWPLRAGGNLSVECPTVVANSLCLVRAGVLRGLGIGLLPRILVQTDLAQGALVAVLPSEVGQDVPVNLLYAESAKNSPKVRAFVDVALGWVRQRLALDPES